MKSTTPRTAIAVALLAVGLLAIPAVLPGQQPGRARDAAQEEEKTPLEQAMGGLKNGMRALRRGLESAESATQALGTIREMQGHALAAMNHCPAPLEEVDAAGAAAWEINFKRAQLHLCDALLTLELAVVEGRLEDAKTIYGSLNDIKSKAHDVYDPE